VAGSDTGGVVNRLQTHKLVLLALGERRLAMPLEMVARLEEIRVDRIETAAGREVVQYRDHILPLIKLSDVLGEPSYNHGSTLQVVVYSENGRSVGLVVDSILDVIETEINIRTNTRTHALEGSGVIDNRVTDLLDVRGIIQSFDPEFYMQGVE
jgi:two-component system, chemotaxis family, sensor kinase CheA